MINQQGSLMGVEGIRPAMNEGRLLFWDLARRRKNIMQSTASTASLLCEICNLGPLSAK
jgi:hypothetical protein